MQRYSGLYELIEEFEHLSMAREDGDEQAITYFKQHGTFRPHSLLPPHNHLVDGHDLDRHNDVENRA